MTALAVIATYALIGAAVAVIGLRSTSEKDTTMVGLLAVYVLVTWPIWVVAALLGWLVRLAGRKGRES